MFLELSIASFQAKRVLADGFSYGQKSVKAVNNVVRDVRGSGGTFLESSSEKMHDAESWSPVSVMAPRCDHVKIRNHIPHSTSRGTWEIQIRRGSK